MIEIEKTYRIFIASCRRMLEEERQTLANIILSKGHLPVMMENSLVASNRDRPTDVDKDKIEECDAVIFVLSYLYGDLIGKKIETRKNCPLFEKKSEIKNCNPCSDHPEGECGLSFTQFEYEYAKIKDKLIYVLCNENYNSDGGFQTANEDYKQTKDGSDCIGAYYKDNDKNISFVSGVTQKFVLHYKTKEEFLHNSSRALTAITTKLKERDDRGEIGLIPSAHYFNLNKEKEGLQTRLEDLQQNGIVEIFDSQAAAIKAIIEEKPEDMYQGQDGNISRVKILAIRGDSFISMGRAWCQFIFDEKFKRNQKIPVEFILGDRENEKLIENRYRAFGGKSAKKHDRGYDVFKKDYYDEMGRAYSSIMKHREDQEHILYIHKESRLPFRMIFMGKYLYLSAFLAEEKATETPVMKILFSSSLYQVCEEYYNRVKEYSKPYLDNIQAKAM